MSNMPKYNDTETKFSNESKVNWFWSYQPTQDKIKKELETNPKYETGYEKAKQIVKDKINS